MAQNQHAEFSGVALHLSRHPKNQHDRSLQAWDSADELLISEIAQDTLSGKTVLIFNDSFGALSCYFLARGAVVFNVSDSKLAQLGLAENTLANELPEAVMLNSLDKLPEHIDYILIKVPRTLAFLEYQLHQISQLGLTKVRVLAGAKVKDIHNSTLSLFEKYLGETKTSLAKKKSRLIYPSSENKSTTAPEPKSWLLDSGTQSHGFNITNLANVFSQEKLDIGGRFLIENLPDIKPDCEVIDLGCGNGVVGLSLLAQSPQAKVTFVDESYMAVESAKTNVYSNMPSSARNCSYLVSDCLSGMDANSADLVLCNPPFHQQNTVTEHIARQMFRDAKRVLRRGGELRIVANAHLPYPNELKKLFGGYQRIAANKKFVILKSLK